MEEPVIEKVKQHWLGSIFIICVAVSGTTWVVARELLVLPREFQITQLKEEVQKLKDEVQKLRTSPPVNPAYSEKESSLALAQTGVIESGSVTTYDGRCSIHIVRVSERFVTLSIAVDSRKPALFENQEVGTRVPVDAGDKTYYVDLHRVRGDIVDLAVYQRRK
jgi:hypothetical protein